MHNSRKSIIFEIAKHQNNTTFSMCKDTTKKSNDQTELFISDAFRVEKPVKVSFTAPELSNLGGLSLIAKSDKESGLCEKFASLIPEWRNETLLVHSLPQLVRQRVYQIAAGFEDADDCDDLRHDSILKMCVGRTPNNVPLALQPTMTRLENRVRRADLFAMGKMFVEHFISSYEKESILNIIFPHIKTMPFGIVITSFDRITFDNRLLIATAVIP